MEVYILDLCCHVVKSVCFFSTSMNFLTLAGPFNVFRGNRIPTGTDLALVDGEEIMEHMANRIGTTLRELINLMQLDTEVWAKVMTSLDGYFLNAV